MKIVEIYLIFILSLNDVFEHRKTKQLRTADLVARYDGEEFAVILPETEKSGSAPDWQL
jgi:PleD family two-component response regulator